MSVRVGIGIATYGLEDARAYFRFAELCERSALDSIWQTDRLNSREPFLEAMSAMAALAGATERIKFGMNAVVLPFRDPLVLAKQCATIDFLSNGRLLPVFGVGAERAPEWRATGREPKGRGRQSDEALQILRRLFSEEQVTFEGEFFQYREASIAPRPVQDPLPVWIGGQSRAAMRRTARYGSGWLAGVASPTQVKPVIEGIREELEKTGRTIDPDHYGAGIAFRFGDSDDPDVQRLGAARARLAGGADPREMLAVGDTASVIERFRAYRDAGASKFVAIPLARGERALRDQTQRLIGEVLPVVHAWS